MGYSVVLYEYEFVKLKEALELKCNRRFGTTDIGRLNQILEQYGYKAINKNRQPIFVVLNNERDEEMNPWYGLADTLDRAFGIENSFDILLELRKTGKSEIDHDAVRERLDIP